MLPQCDATVSLGGSPVVFNRHHFFVENLNLHNFINILTLFN